MVHDTEEEFKESDQKNAAEYSSDTPSSSQDRLQKDYQELHERFLRLAADFDNFRKRTARDLEAQVKFAIEEFAIELLEVIDNFERAARADETGAGEGLTQIHKLFETVLERHGIRPITSVGKRFNPAEHEAVVCIASDQEEGTIVEEYCRGYCMHDRVIRCARVAVSKGREGE
ncbi:MAG: nucleotide exchange factor GrpE [Methanoregulaceae archaeon]|jgi:molecular chaperone GrpE|nr:nucleotide exchange factor GrpE [Methanoregulaceae archaeon]